jgi:4-hydroxy-tetrahydrodipicolinate reductase
MTQPIRLAINGALGRMGRALVALAGEDPRFVLVHAVVEAGAPYAAQPIDGTANLRYATEWGSAPPVDVAIDFSSEAGLAATLDFCTLHGVALVSGSTGLGAAMPERLRAASQRIPLMHASNFSLGTAVLARLLRAAAVALPDWDLEIVEAHHGRKLDAPSGTALSLGEAAADARGTTLGQMAARGDRAGPRRPGSIGFAVVRGGDIVGEHTALLIGHGERVELGHRASDRSVFARGALEAAYWLAGHAPGAYGLDDMLADRRPI